MANLLSRLSISILTLLFCLSVTLIATPADTSTASIINTIRSRYNDSASIEAVFDLTIYWSVREKEEKRSGHIWLAKGDRFRIESGDNIYVSDGRTCWQYNKQNKQVIIKDLLDIDVSMLPSQMFTDYVQNFSYQKVAGTGDLVTLQSKGGSAGHVKTVTMTVKPGEPTIQSIEIIDKSDNKSTYRFAKLRSGIKIAGDLFYFDPPKGTNVFDSRQ